MKPLESFLVRHAGRRQVRHPELGVEVQAQTAVAYLRFPSGAAIDAIEVPTVAGPEAGRWVPAVPAHPAHLIISTLDEESAAWRVVREVDLPVNPAFAGEGLTPETPMSEMEEFFKKAVAAQAPHRIELEGIRTRCLKIECDREHPVWPNHGECNGGAFNVPFATLAKIRAFGQADAAPVPDYRPKLRRGRFAPVAPEGMSIDLKNPLEIVFRGSRLSVGFSLTRPMLTRLDWDFFGSRAPTANRLVFRGSFGGNTSAAGGQNGPSYRTAAGDFFPHNMSGTVEVEGATLRYRDIDVGGGVRVDARFAVSADSIRVELVQHAERPLPAIEGFAWQLLWNMRGGLTGVAGLPAEFDGRNGFVELPALITADTGGCLCVRSLEGDGRFHTESHRYLEIRSTSFFLGQREASQNPALIPAGTHRAVFELSLSALAPRDAKPDGRDDTGVRRAWGAGFSAFRPELGGFSNNAISTHCHVNQYIAFDFAAFTRRPDNGPDPLDLVKFSLGRALLDGGGYGYHRDLYLDSDPILVSGAGRVLQLSHDHGWLERIRPGVVAAVRRMLSQFEPEPGMVVCRHLSGDSGTHRWSSNAMDVIGFGHIDAYVNAWAYRGFRNATVLLDYYGERELARRAQEAAAAIAANYERHLLNPETGWVAGWRSRDGCLHDFAFLWVNGVAAAFGVLRHESARTALCNLEALRNEVFPESGYHGLPLNLLPIPREDHMLPTLGFEGRPTFENYTDGALSPVLTNYYLRALAQYRLEAEHSLLVERLERAFGDGMFHGPFGTGKEFMTWTGADSGYEGTFGPNSGPLYALAVARGEVHAPEPEWWPGS